MANNRQFWQDRLGRRVSRRQALRGAALSAASVAGVAAIRCGGDEETPGTPEGGTPLPGRETPTPGGTYIGTMADLYNRDPHKATAFLTHVFASWIYSRLMRYDSTRGELPEDRWYKAVPELGQEVENPDELTYTFTLNPAAKWQNIDPTFGRQVTADDIVFSFNRYRDLSKGQGQLALVVDSVSAPDSGTVTFKLKHPFALFLTRVASYQDLWILPPELIEADGDAEKRSVGSGPFILDHYRSSVDFEFLKNPDYWETDPEFGLQLPYIDRLRLLVIPDPNAVLSQFIAGKLFGITTQPQLVPEALSAVPDLRINRMLRNLVSFFYFEPATYTSDKGPFNDVRVRRAISMAIDRDGLLALVRAPIDKEGGEWCNMIPAGLGRRWWVDPKSEEMGEAAKWYKHDIAEAKSLLSAAGYADGFDTKLHYSSTVYTNIIPYYPVVAEAFPTLMRDIGVNITAVPEDYIGQYFPQTFSQGNFDGMAWGLQSNFTDVVAYLSVSFLPFGEGGYRNMSRVNDPELIAKIEDMSRDPDVESVREKSAEIQRYISDQMYYVPGLNAIDYGIGHPWGSEALNKTGPAGGYGLGTETSMWGWIYPEYQNMG
ncbi:MAG: ABC transporter substrate-binding protein [Dehalococcoidia bacterium]|nr:ABC transporter substrate-binding protein [Dehalococcoidia bacterium]